MLFRPDNGKRRARVDDLLNQCESYSREVDRSFESMQRIIDRLDALIKSDAKKYAPIAEAIEIMNRSEAVEATQTPKLDIAKMVVVPTASVITMLIVKGLYDNYLSKLANASGGIVVPSLKARLLNRFGGPALALGAALGVDLLFTLWQDEVLCSKLREAISKLVAPRIRLFTEMKNVDNFLTILKSVETLAEFAENLPSDNASSEALKAATLKTIQAKLEATPHMTDTDAIAILEKIDEKCNAFTKEDGDVPALLAKLDSELLAAANGPAHHL